MSKSRACGEQNAHAPSRRKAFFSGRRVTRAAACDATDARKAVRPVYARTCGEQDAHPVCAFSQPRTPAHLRWARRAPSLCLFPASHARAPAVSKSRACGEQVAHRVYAFAQPRTHAVVSECVPAPGLCSLRPTSAPGKSPALRFTCAHYTRKAMSKAREWTNFIEHLFAFYHGFAAADGSAGPLHAQNGAIKEERAPCETAPRRE